MERISSLTILLCLVNLGFTASYKQAVNYNGRNLKFIVFSNPPYDVFTPGPNGTFTFKGATFDTLLWLAAKYNFTYTLVPLNQSLVKEYGTHEASFYQLINNQDIDGITCPFYVTMDRLARMDFTFLVWYEELSLIVPRPGEESRIFAIIGPFQPKVWLFMLLSIITIVGTMTFFIWFYHSHFNKVNADNAIPAIKACVVKVDLILNSLSTNMIYLINVMTNQGSGERNARVSFRILAGFWLMGAMVLVYSYSSVVMSFLTVPKMKSPIDSFEELAASETVGILLRHDMSVGEQILQATSGVYKILGDQARDNPEQIVGDPNKVFTMLETGRYAYSVIRTYCKFFVAVQHKKDGLCRFRVSKPLAISPGYYSWLMKKGSPYVSQFSRGLMDLWESGISRFWVFNVIPRADKCIATDNRYATTRQTPIRLSDLTSAFFILGIGLSLSTLCFLLELFRFHI